MKKTLFLLVFFLAGIWNSSAQGFKVNITYTLPTALNVCGVPDTFSFTLQNISTGTVSGITTAIRMPAGVEYVPGSVTGGGVTESSVTNKSRPVFSVPSLSLATSVTFKVAARANCSIISFVTGGGSATDSVIVNYAGNYDFKVTNPFTIKIPNLAFTSISNQTITTTTGTTFVRSFTITNSGLGSLTGFQFYQKNGNGVSITSVTPGTHTTNGDTIFTKLDTANFRSIGNGDPYFDYLEAVVITDTVYVSGCSNLTSSFAAWWGCDGSKCQTASSTGSVTLSSSVPNLLITPSTKVNYCYGGAGQNSVGTLRIINTGTGMAASPQFEILQPYALYTAFDTARITYRKGINGTKIKYSPTTVSNPATPPSCLPSGTFGRFVINLPNINPKDTYYVDYEIVACCYRSCNSSGAILRWDYKGSYKNACGTTTYTVTQTVGNNGYSMYMTMSNTVPADIRTGTSRVFRYTINSYSLWAYDNSSEMEVVLNFPAALSVDTAFFISASGNSVWNYSSKTTSGGTTRLVFTGATPFSLLQADLVLRVSADCSKGSGKKQNYGVSIYHRPTTNCTDTCSNQVYCLNSNINIHCNNSCGVGMEFYDLYVNRTNLGIPDNNEDGKPDLTGTIDSLRVRMDRVMVGDTFQVVYKGVVRTNTTISSFRYGYAQTTFNTYGNLITPVDAHIEVKKINGTVYNCDSVGFTSTYSGTTSRFKFDFSVSTMAGKNSACFASSYRYMRGDTVLITARYVLSGNPGGVANTINVNTDYFYLSNVQNPTLATDKIQCDTFSGAFTVVGYYFTTAGPEYTYVNGCNNTTTIQSYYMSIGPCCSNYYGGNMFPAEYRNWGYLKKARVVVPTGFDFVDAYFYEFRTAGSGTYALSSKFSVVPSGRVGDTIEFDTDKFYDINGGAWVPSDDGFAGSIYVVFRPTCNVQPNTNIPVSYYFDFQNTFLDSVESKSATGTGADIIYYYPPDISITPALSKINATGDTVTWEVTVYNNSPTSIANNVFIHANAYSGVRIVRMNEKVTNTKLVDSNSIFRLGVLNVASSKTYKITGVYNKCTLDSIQLQIGWGCGGYPKDINNISCANTGLKQLTLFVEPTGTTLQNLITDSTYLSDLCATLPFTIEVYNINDPKAYNVRTTIELPVGLEIVPGSSRLYYPVTGPGKPIADPVKTTGLTYQWDVTAAEPTFKTQGLKGITDIAMSKYHITFRVKTSCDYASGSFFKVRSYGNLSCGDQIAGPITTSNYLNIKGITQPYFSVLFTEADSIQACSGESIHLKGRFINVGMDTTQDLDYLQVLLPPGLAYDSGSFVSLHNAPADLHPVITDFNGTTRLEWKIPPGITIGDSVNFSLDAVPDGSIACNSVDVLFQAVTKQLVTCVADGSSCLNSVITGLRNQPVSVEKGVLAINSLQGQAIQVSSTQEQVSMSMKVQNTGGVVDTNSYVYFKVYYDADSTTTLTAADQSVFVDSFRAVPGPGGYYYYSDSFKVNAGKACKMLVVIDSPSCICKNVVSGLQAPLKNAGPDVSTCSGDSVAMGLPKLTGYGYQWIPDSGLSNAFVSDPKVMLKNNTGSFLNKTYILRTSRGGCFNYDTMLVKVAPAIQLDLGPDVSICNGDSFHIPVSLSGGTPAYKRAWASASGLADTTVLSPWVKPTATTVYRLYVSDSLGCSTLDSVKVTVKERPKAKFDLVPQCSTYTVQFIDSTYAPSGITGYYWDFGDGNYAATSSPSNTFPGFGAYNVKLTVTGTSGCQDTYTRTVNVLPIPDAQIKYISPSCVTDTINFTDSSSIGSGSISSYYWEFGDGSTSVQQNPRYRYTVPGSYTVKLKVTSAGGCTDSVIRTVVLTNGPKAQAYISGRVCAGYTTVTIKDTSVTPSGTTITSRWIKVQDTTYVGTTGAGSYGASISKMFTSPGTYPVDVYVKSSNGCEDQARFFVYVDTVPDPRFTVSFTCEGDSTYFNKDKVDTPAIVRWHWKFGDGDTSNLPSPVHKYAAAGYYQAELEVTNAAGCTSHSYNVFDVNPRPDASFSVADVCLGDSSRFSNLTSFTGVPPVLRYRWDFGNGDTSILKNPVYKYQQPGAYTVQLKVTSLAGCTDTFSRTVYVHPRAVPGFTVSGNCMANKVFFNDTSGVSTGSIQYSTWNFGDGSTGSGISTDHIYADSGDYRVSLVVETQAGCKDSVVRYIHIDPLPRVGFTSQDVCVADSARFTDTSSVSAGTLSSWNWTFGDGGSSSVPSPSHLYANPGTYNVTLRVLSSKGCSDSATRTITVHPMPVAAFNVSNICQDDTLRLVDLSSGAASRTWLFSDGSSDTATAPLKTFANPGTYQVKLVVQTAYSCPDSLEKTVYIHPKPRAGWQAANSCGYDSIRFADTSRIAFGQIAQWEWSFGDGNSSSLQNPAHLYSSPGTYNVSLKITSDSGCSDIFSRQITVYPQPDAHFNGDLNICYGDSAHFSDFSAVSSGTIQHWYWDFGDGNQSAQQHPVHFYASSGTYSVQLKVATNEGCLDSVSRTVTVYPKPAAAFNMSFNCQRDSVYFSNLSTGAIANYSWDFGDGNSSSATSPVHHYSTYGTYNIRLITTTGDGCRDTADRTFYLPPNPAAKISSPAGVCVPEALWVADSSSIATGTMVSRKWYFGDGATDTAAVASHLYSAPGHYTLSLVRISDAGCKDSVSQPVTIYPMPEAHFRFGFNCIADTTLFEDSTQLAFGNIVRWEWDFGDGSTDTVQHPGHQFPARGAYNVKLKVTTDGGCQDSITRLVYVKPSPYAGFTYVPACSYDSIRFTDTSVVMIGAITSWNWNFGDGQTSSLRHPAHLYASEGNYTVILKVGTDSGCTSTEVKTVTVNALPRPRIDFSNTCFGDSTRFSDSTNLAFGFLTDWRWDFGDGSSSQLRNPVHFYASNGTYPVKLWVKTNSGCEDSTDTTINVWDKPQAGFNTLNNCVRDTIHFLDNSNIAGSGTLISYTWNYGDGSPEETNGSGKHHYTIPGTYNVSYRILTSRGCMDTVEKQVIVDPMPSADFSFSNTCVSDSVYFTDNSSVAGDTITQWLWSFGDGQTSALQHPAHKYSAPGTYTVKLKSWSDEGCPDSASRSVQIYYLPSIRYSLSASCEYDSARFFDNSYVLDGNVSYRMWYFGDGDSSSAKNPVHHYPGPGNYNGKLVIGSNHGCVDSVVFTMPVFYQPNARFTANAACFADSVYFADSSYMDGGTDPVNSWAWNFGDGQSSTLRNPAHQYASPGFYNVSLVAATSRGCKDTVEKIITVPAEPEARIAFSNTCYGDSTGFADSTRLVFGSRTQWRWNFGDGNTSIQQNPKHFYTSDGTYTVRLWIKTNSGCEDSTDTVINVWTKPRADFQTVNNCVRDTIHFVNTSNTSGSGGLIYYVWDFGDGSPETVSVDAQHKYAAPGTYNVSYKIWTLRGCMDTIEKQVVVDPMPVADFSVSNTCVSDSVYFTDNSSVAGDTITQWLWSFGDGQTSALQHPAHKYSAPGTYTVKLKSWSDEGCPDSTSRSVQIYYLPSIRYSLSASCEYDSARFFDNSYVLDGNVSYRMWYFGDGDSSSAKNPVHHYPGPGNYNGKLVIGSNHGCVDSIGFSMPVFWKPVAGLSTGGNVCQSDSARFMDTSMMPGGTDPVSTWYWDFGDGQSSTRRNPGHHYNAPGTYSITLIAGTSRGCKDTAQGSIRVYSVPEPGFLASYACEYDSVFLADTSVIRFANIVSRSWDLGDGTVSNDSVVRYKYAAPGFYQVKLRVYSDSGCVDSVTKVLRIDPKPVAAFLVADVCLDDSARFIDQSLAGPNSSLASWKWYFGDGDSSSLQHPVHKYSAPGTYPLMQVVINAGGCIDTSTGQIVVHPEPHAGFTFDNVCLPDSMIFRDTSTLAYGLIVQQLWDFGDGLQDSGAHVAHRYLNPGFYNVKLKILTDKGCVDSVIQAVIVYPLPDVQYNAVPSCAYDSARFEDISTVAYGSIVSRTWYFGDGDSSQQQQVAHHYPAPGTYRTVLKVTSSFGCVDSAEFSTPVYPKPVSAFSLADICLSDSSHFSDLSHVSSGTITSWKWYFGNGDSSSSASPVYRYSQPGTYTVSQVVTTNFGCKDTSARQIIIHPLPVPGFTATVNCVYDSTRFTDTSRIASGSIVSHRWYFGDGNSASSASPAHQYAAGGNYTVKLVLTSDQGCKDSIARSISIPYKPQADIRFQDVCLGTGLQFKDSSSVTAAVISGRQWNFGDGYADTSSHPVHVYAAPGLYPVRLIVTSDKGCKDTTWRNVRVYPLPQLKWSAMAGCIYDPVSFRDSSRVDSGLVAGRVWYFGDGNTDTSQNPLHLYASPGNYLVKLVATSTNGCKDSLSKSIRVRPRPSGTISTANVCVSDSASFEDTGVPPSGLTVASRNWYFGDGNTGTGKLLKHKYSAPGTYNITLVSVSDSGCYDTTRSSITIYDLPKVWFSYNRSCDNDTVQFLDSSSVLNGSLSNPRWDFGDGAVATGFRAAHHYAAPGNYQVKLKVKSSLGCEDSVVRMIRVYRAPRSGPRTQAVCAGNATVFTDSSLANEGNINSWYWEFGDGNSSSLQHPTHTYAQGGTYTARLTVVTDLACSHTDSVRVRVNFKPEAGFSYVPACQDLPIQFTDTSSVVADSITTWRWEFGDGDSSFAETPVHQYDTSGYFNVRLIASSSAGCADTILQTVYVPARPVLNVLKANTCANDSFLLQDQSSVDSGRIVAWEWTLPGGVIYTDSLVKTRIPVPGTYAYQLKVTSNFGCEAIFSDSITIYPVPQPWFRIQSACLYDSVLFTDSSFIASGTIAQYDWDFGDGNTASGTSVSHRYGAAGTYTVWLRTVSGNGCRDSISRTVFLPSTPEAGFRFVENCFYDSLRFTDTSSIASGSITGWSWDFGDGNTSALQHPAHRYATAGSYQVKLKVSSIFGCVDSAIRTVEAYARPQAIAQLSNGCEQEPLQFTDRSTVSNAVINRWLWNFGDGTTSTQQNPTHKYLQDSASYQVKLKVWSDKGCTDSSTYSIVIFDQPKAAFSGADVCVIDSARFFDNSTVKLDTLQSWSWDFGDGNTSNLQNPVHLYATPGTYRVWMETVSSKGCKDSVSHLITVNPVPVVDFEVMPGMGCEPLTVAFRNKTTVATGAIKSWRWDFGDGTTSTDKDPVHTYPNAGSYNVELLAVTDKNCQLSLQVIGAVDVFVRPKAGFIYSEDTLSFLNPVISLQDTSKPGVTAREWSFGDGERSTLQNLEYEYLDTGRFNLSLAVFNAAGCSDTALLPVWIKPDYTIFIPNAFTPNQDKLNGEFKPGGIFKGIRNYEMQVFNRWGQLMFETQDVTKGWNGQIHNTGEQAQEGVYIYYIFFFDYYGHTHTYKGNITLLR